MKYLELTEAPLADFDIVGDTTTAGSFNYQDLKAMQNEKWKTKVYKAFSKTPYDFNIYLYNAPEGIANIGKQRYPNSPKNFPVQVNNLEKLSDFVGVREISLISQIIGKPIPNYETSITVLLVENEGAERVSLTPWIMAHRVVHALMYSSFPEIEEEIRFLYNNFINDMERVFLWSKAYSEKMKQLYGNYERISYIAEILSKFKSGRMGKLSNSGEFIIESITQYLVTGSISYNRIEIDDEGRSKPITDPLLKIAREIKFTSTEHPREDFIKYVLKKEFTKIPKREPRVRYIGYDRDGDAVVSMGEYHNTEERIKKYQDEFGYTFKKIIPTKAAIQKWSSYKSREQELNKLWVDYRYDGLLGNGKTATDTSDEIIDAFEKQLTQYIIKLLDSCVGKAVVL